MSPQLAHSDQENAALPSPDEETTSPGDEIMDAGLHFLGAMFEM